MKHVDLLNHISACRLNSVIKGGQWSKEELQVNAFVAIGLNAAFDTMDHAIFLNVMRGGESDLASLTQLNYGFESYLQPMGFRVKIDHYTSNSKE